MTPRALGMLGLCARAGRLVSGEKAVVQAIRNGGCFLAILDGGVAANGDKAVTQACQTHGIPLLRTEPGALGEAVGKPGRMAVAVTDEGMARRMIELSQPIGGR